MQRNQIISIGAMYGLYILVISQHLSTWSDGAMISILVERGTMYILCPDMQLFVCAVILNGVYKINFVYVVRDKKRGFRGIDINILNIRSNLFVKYINFCLFLVLQHQCTQSNKTIKIQEIKYLTNNGSVIRYSRLVLRMGCIFWFPGQRSPKIGRKKIRAVGRDPLCAPTTGRQYNQLTSPL